MSGISLLEKTSVQILKDLLRGERLARIEAEAIAERGVRELHERTQQMQLLGAIALAARSSQSLEEVFQFTLESICEGLGWAHGNAYLTQFREGKPVLRRVSSCTLRESEKLTRFRDDTLETPFLAAASLPGRVLDTGRFCWISDLSGDDRFLGQQAALDASLQSSFAFPVTVKDDIIAVFEFFSHRIFPPQMQFVDLMSQVGNHLGRIIERTRIQEQLVIESTHDALTGLPDRSLLMDRLTLAIHRLQRDASCRFALLFLDINRFKLINNSLGHSAGDGLIAQVAERLADALRTAGLSASLDPAGRGDSEILCRFGGDEFAVVLDAKISREDVAAVCHLLHKALELPFYVLEREVFVAISIGVSFASSGLTSPAEVLHDANLNMQRAKPQVRSQHVFYDPDLSPRVVDRLEVESALRRAVQRKEFVMHYQPIVKLATGEITGFEALIRWNKPGTGLVLPQDFIQIAEESGLILPIGDWVMEEACRTAHRWHLKFHRERPYTIGVNLSARQFSQPNLVRHVASLLDETGIWPGSLLFEITESVSMEDVDQTISVLNELAMLGIRATVDDFGTGFSSLSYLHRLPTSALKIDRSFVGRMHEDRDSRAIVLTILNLARDLGMDVVAEGIESEAQAELLKVYDCKFGQGYFFSKPLSENDASDLLERFVAAEGVS